jgi:Ni/Co efflux regulator RcnB
MESGRQLSDDLKIEMFDVLTDEQWDRFQNLVDNPPDYIKKIIAQVSGKFVSAASAPVASKPSVDGAKSDAWQPGPGSWQPGDPIPEKYRQERNEKRNFPRPKPKPAE